MRLSFFRARFLILVGAASVSIVLPVASSGCGRTACIVYSKGEYDARSSCPAQADALPYFSDPTCPGAVVSVDGEGVFNLNAEHQDQSLCCYPVTQQDIELDDERIDCTPPEGIGGSGGVEFGGSSGVGGVGGGFGGCFTCNDAFFGLMNVKPSFLCSESVDFWFSLQSCVCAGDTCQDVCDLNFCSDNPVSKDCMTCVSSMTNCAVQAEDCNFN